MLFCFERVITLAAVPHSAAAAVAVTASARSKGRILVSGFETIFRLQACHLDPAWFNVPQELQAAKRGGHPTLGPKRFVRSQETCVYGQYDLFVACFRITL
eukprot:3571201-Rhodomonas_salina.1